MGFIGNAVGGIVKGIAGGSGSNVSEVKDLVHVGPNGEILNQQQAYADQLKAQANGQGPSVATAMLNQQAQQNAANAMGMAAAQHGVNPGLAMRQAMQANGAANQQTAAQASTARMQEQLNAQGQLGNQLNTMQSQNMQGQANSAGLNTQIATGNAGNNAAMTGGLISGAAGMLAHKAHGGVIEGHAQVAGDDPANDTVHTMLSPGEIVIPRSVAQSPGFMEALKKHVEQMHGEAKGFARVLASRGGQK